MLSTKENIRAILECNFAGFKDEYIEIALNRIMEIIDEANDIQYAYDQGFKNGYELGTECMDEDAKQASIPYTYDAPKHDWKCGYPDITRGKDK